METAEYVDLLSDNGKLDFIGHWLDRKATSPEDLAELCYDSGAKGEPQCPTGCVIVSLVERTFGVKVTATQFGIRLRNSASNRSFTPSAVVCEFMTRFDQRFYLHLIGPYQGDPFSGNTTH